VSANVKYVVALHKYALNLSTSFSRQDGASNISSLNAVFAYSRQFSGRWFYTGLLAGQQSSQLSLDIRGTVGGGLGRYLVRSNKVDFALWGGVGYSRERFTNQDADDLPIGIVAADFEYFTFGDLTTSLSSKLSVVPVLTEGRVRLNFMTQYKREVVNNLYLTLSLTEIFDSKPPETANKNDLSLTTSIGWSF
jgi:putative salt-induced outer membrane protein YdiY